MNTAAADWEQRVANLWAAFEVHAADSFVARVEALAAERPPGDAAALFERGCAQDSTGRPEEAIALYQAALDAGVTGIRRRRAVIQMSSSLRNVGQPERAVARLTAELDAPSDELDGAVRAFLALALVSLGREREAVAHSLTALSRCLPRYNRSLARYAGELFPGHS